MHENIHEWIIQDEERDEDNEIGSIEQLRLHYHGNYPRVLRSVGRPEKFVQPFAVEQESSNDERSGKDVDRQRKAPESEGEIHCTPRRGQI